MSDSFDTLALAAQLVRVPSVTPDDRGCQAQLAARLERIGFKTEALNCGAVSNLYAKRGRAAPHLTFVGHTDVVPPGDADAWLYPPFSATVADGMLYGRGAADMKGSIAAMVTACERLFARGGAGFDGTLSMLITSDEEGPAVAGTRHALAELTERGETFQYCLVGEPTSEKTLADTIKVGRRGSLSATLTVRGQQGHVAYPQLADNPIHRAGPLVAHLAQYRWHDGDELFPDTALQISNIHAGVGADNVIPAELKLNFNIRYSPAQRAESLIHDIETLCRAHTDNCVIEWQEPSHPYHSQNGHFAELVGDAVYAELGTRARRSSSGGTSDGRFVASTGAEVVELGPLNATIHQVNECVSVRDLDRLSNIYQRVIEQLAAQHPLA